MPISRRTDYALRLVTVLARSDGSPVSVREAAAEQEVPYSFARSIQHDLVLSGIVEARRGSRGGIVLARPASDLTVLDVLEAVQGGVTISNCTLEDGWCPRAGACAFHDLWLKTDAVVREYLASLSLADIAEDEAFKAGIKKPAPAASGGPDVSDGEPAGVDAAEEPRS